MDSTNVVTTCCSRCQNWGNCYLMWVRGEQGKTQYCCDLCLNFTECNSLEKQTPPDLSEGDNL